LLFDIHFNEDWPLDNHAITPIPARQKKLHTTGPVGSEKTLRPKSKKRRNLNKPESVEAWEWAKMWK
jgi:hypothetical protein